MTKKDLYGRVALQVRIEPDTYDVGPETVDAGSKVIDPNFSNSELEWSTDRRGVIIITGVLIKVETANGGFPDLK